MERRRRRVNAAPPIAHTTKSQLPELELPGVLTLQLRFFFSAVGGVGLVVCLVGAGAGLLFSLGEDSLGFACSPSDFGKHL